MPDVNTVLTYNGVDLQIGRVLDFDMRAVYDDTGVDYLYTHFRVKVSCVFNPKATASTTNNAAGDTAAASVTFLRHKLLQARQPLQVSVGADTMLASPLTNVDAQVPYATDANNGPHPIDLQVLSVHGAKSILCVYEIETWLNECGGDSGGNPPPTILSHRWEMSEDVGEDYLSTRTISGRAVFRTDFLLAESAPNPNNGALVPDDFRAYLLHPVPAGFRRTLVKAQAESDGTALSYVIVDEEQPWPLNSAQAGNIIRIEGWQETGWDWLGLWNPSLHTSIHLEAWGTKAATNRDLANALLTTLSTATKGNATKKPWQAAVLRVDLGRRHASLDLRQVLGAALTTIKQIADWVQGNPTGLDEIPLAENFGNLGGPGRTDTVAPPGDGGARSAALERIFSQLNTKTCQAPAVVSDRGTALNARSGV